MRKLLAGLVTIGLVAGFGWSVRYLYGKSQKPPARFETEAPFVATIVKKTVATGSVVPRQEVAIKPQVSGIIESILVEPGDAVKRGDPVARIRIIPNMLSLASAGSRVNRARLGLENARQDLERHQELARQGVVPDSTLQQYKLASETAKEELAAALDNLELIRKGTTARTREATNTIVRSTLDGTVLEVPVEPGGSVIESNTFNDGTTIATIADMTEILFKGKVDESEVGKLAPGMELELTIGAIEGKKFMAILEHIAPKGAIQEGAIQFEIRAALKLIEGTFVRANLSANADIVLARKENVLAIHESLLQFDKGTPFVEVETTPQTFEKRTIETGLSDGIAIEVVKGLGKDDKVKDASKGPSS
jgi:HlyD family secretion protein